MEAAMIIWLIGSFIFFFVLYLIIQSAIDNSTMAKNIQSISDTLEQLASRTAPQQNQIPNDVESDPEGDEECPACGAKVWPDSSACPGCGLKLTD